MRSLVIAAFLLFPASAIAEGIDVAPGLADVLAAEDFCGLDYDPRDIERFVAHNVRNDDLEFTGMLKGLIFVAEAAQEKMSASAKSAHCTQIRRLAAHFAFTSN